MPVLGAQRKLHQVSLFLRITWIKPLEAHSRQKAAEMAPAVGTAQALLSGGQPGCGDAATPQNPWSRPAPLVQLCHPAPVQLPPEALAASQGVCQVQTQTDCSWMPLPYCTNFGAYFTIRKILSGIEAI